MSAVRESIARKLHVAMACQFDSKECDDIVAMLNELGRHEAAAIKHLRQEATDRATIQTKTIEAEEFRALLGKERRGLWDGYASAAIAAGNPPAVAASIADAMMAIRKERNP